MPYSLSVKSRAKLAGVHEALIAVVERAIQLSTVDFTIGEGVRSLERQKQLLAQGKSKTLNSRHITGHAVDLWAYVNGNVSWDFTHYEKIAKAVGQAAAELKTPITWGAVWDKRVADYTDPTAEVQAYKKRRKAIGKTAFLDGPHFELDKSAYP